VSEAYLNQSRRNFLLKILQGSGQLVLASTAIYTTSLFTGSTKFGGLTAGAKSWQFGKGVKVPASGCETHDSAMYATQAACEAAYNPTGFCKASFEPCWKNP